MADYLIQDTTLTAIADSIRAKTGSTSEISVSDMSSSIDNIYPTLNNPGTSADLLSGKELIDQDGNIITGTIPTKTSSDLTSSGATVTVPTGYYASLASKSVSTATQATPSISVNSSGLITASATQSAGYVSSGTKSATKQLTTKAAATITPGTADQTIASGTYLTGVQTIKGDSNLVAGNIMSGVSIFGVEGTASGGGGDINGKNFACGQITLASSTTTNVVLADISDLGFNITATFADKVALVWCNPQSGYSSNLVFAGRMRHKTSSTSGLDFYFKLSRANSITNSGSYPVLVKNNKLYLAYDSNYPFYVGVTYSWLIIDKS